MLTDADRANIAQIRLDIANAIFKRDLATGEIKANAARLEPYYNKCGHPNGYKTSCMGESGFYCPECGYDR